MSDEPKIMSLKKGKRMSKISLFHGSLVEVRHPLVKMIMSLIP